MYFNDRLKDRGSPGALEFQANIERGSPRVLIRQENPDFHCDRSQDLIRSRFGPAAPREILAEYARRLASLGAFDFRMEIQGESTNPLRRVSVLLNDLLSRSYRPERFASIAHQVCRRSIRVGRHSRKGATIALSSKKNSFRDSTVNDPPITVGSCLRSRRADRTGYVGPHREREHPRGWGFFLGVHNSK